MFPRPSGESKPNQQSKVADYGADLGKYKWWQTEDEVTLQPFQICIFLGAGHRHHSAAPGDKRKGFELQNGYWSSIFLSEGSSPHCRRANFQPHQA